MPMRSGGRNASKGSSKKYSDKPLTSPIDYPFFILIITLLAIGILMRFSRSFSGYS